MVDIVAIILSVLWVSIWIRLAADYSWKKMEETKHPITTWGIVCETLPSSILALLMIMMGCLPIIIYVFGKGY